MNTNISAVTIFSHIVCLFQLQVMLVTLAHVETVEPVLPLSLGGLSVTVGVDGVEVPATITRVCS